MQYVIGIDAGGTKTVGLLADETGQVLAEERGSGANLQTHGELEVEKVFDDVMEALGQGRTISAVGLATVRDPRSRSRSLVGWGPCAELGSGCSPAQGSRSPAA